MHWSRQGNHHIYQSEGENESRWSSYTVGVLDVSPNAFSVVPGRVDFTLQVRDLSSDSMEDFVEDVCSKFDLRHEIKHQSEPALCDPDIQKMIGDSAS